MQEQQLVAAAAHMRHMDANFLGIALLTLAGWVVSVRDGETEPPPSDFNAIDVLNNVFAEVQSTTASLSGRLPDGHQNREATTAIAAFVHASDMEAQAAAMVAETLGRAAGHH